MTVTVRVEGDGRWARSVRARIARVPGAIVTERAADLEIVRASRVRPTLAIDRALADDEESRAATALGASILAWEGRDDWSHWQQCLAPIRARPLRGEPDRALRWALLEETAAGSIPARADGSWQWHLLVRAPLPLPAHVVQWACDDVVAAPLLGAAEAVVGHAEPLVHDAWRLGRPVLAPRPGVSVEAWPLLPRPRFDARLAHAVPPLLAEWPGFWEAIVATCASGATLAPAMRASIVRAAREEVLREERTRAGVARRQLRRLREDPRGLLREARLWAMRTLWSRARPPTRAGGPRR